MIMKRRIVNSFMCANKKWRGFRNRIVEERLIDALPRGKDIGKKPETIRLKQFWTASWRAWRVSKMRGMIKQRIMLDYF